MSNDSRWYVVHTYSGYENKVATNILKAAENRKMQDEIFEVKIPTETVVEVREDGKTREVERKIFPGYVMVKIATFLDENDMPKISDEAWLVIRGTRGATGFVGSDGKAVPLTEQEIYDLGVERREIVVGYQLGDTVRVNDGPLAGFNGIVDELEPDKNRVRVVVSMFGRETPVDLELDQVEVIKD